jgi:hypothetical protein
MAEIVSLRDGIAELVHDGDSVALEGFTDLAQTGWDLEVSDELGQTEPPTDEELAGLRELVSR